MKWSPICRALFLILFVPVTVLIGSGCGDEEAGEVRFHVGIIRDDCTGTTATGQATLSFYTSASDFLAQQNEVLTVSGEAWVSDTVENETIDLSTLTDGETYWLRVSINDRSNWQHPHVDSALPDAQYFHDSSSFGSDTDLDVGPSVPQVSDAERKYVGSYPLTDVLLNDQSVLDNPLFQCHGDDSLTISIDAQLSITVGPDSCGAGDEDRSYPWILTSECGEGTSSIQLSDDGTFSNYDSSQGKTITIVHPAAGNGDQIKLVFTAE